jgi:tetratricopeptide (TPR) repeat protein
MGSRSCKECHQQFYELWESSYHGRAMMDFTQEFAETNLSECSNFIPVGNSAFQYELKSTKGQMIEKATQHSYPIHFVLGGKYVFYFLTPFDKGKLQVLPLGYDVKKKEWFDITKSSIRGHQQIQDEALSWTDRRYTFNTACFSCHVSQRTTEYSISKDSYHTTWLEAGINCETCHGPAEKHNDVFKKAKITGIKPDSSYLKTITRSKGYQAERVDASCAYCHAKSIPLSKEYIVGEDFFQHYDLVGPENADFYPDARDLGENYTYTSWLMSPCRKDERMDCLHCHTSSGRFRQKDNPNAACLPCHENRVAHASEHTHHPKGSKGNECIQCHMPKTSFARMDRSDHSMRPPVPAATRAYGSPNACNSCHSTQSIEWAEEFILEHFSGKYQEQHMREATLLDQLRRGDISQLDDVVSDLHLPGNEIIQSAMIRSLQNIHDDRVIPLMLNYMQSESPLLRSSAATTLGDYPNESIRLALFKALQDSVRLVRIRAVGELLNIDKNDIPEEYHESYNTALHEYTLSLHAYPDQEISHFNLGHFHESQENDKEAKKEYMRALKLRRSMSEASMNLAMLYYRNGQVDSSLLFFQETVKQDPEYAPAYLNLGLLYGEMNWKTKALESFHKAYQLQNYIIAAYNLSILYSNISPDSTLKYAEIAYEKEPGEEKYIYTYAYYLSEYGRTKEAQKILENAITSNHSSFDIYYLLGMIYEHSGNMEAYKKLSKKAENHGFDI